MAVHYTQKERIAKLEQWRDDHEARHARDHDALLLAKGISYRASLTGQYIASPQIGEGERGAE